MRCQSGDRVSRSYWWIRRGADRAHSRTGQPASQVPSAESFLSATVIHALGAVLVLSCGVSVTAPFAGVPIAPTHEVGAPLRRDPRPKGSTAVSRPSPPIPLQKTVPNINTALAPEQRSVVTPVLPGRVFPVSRPRVLIPSQLCQSPRTAAASALAPLRYRPWPRSKSGAQNCFCSSGTTRSVTHTC